MIEHPMGACRSLAPDAPLCAACDEKDRAARGMKRRGFLSLFGMAAVGLLLPKVPAIEAPTIIAETLVEAVEPVALGGSTLITPAWVTAEVAKRYVNSLRGLRQFDRLCSAEFSRMGTTSGVRLA